MRGTNLNEPHATPRYPRRRRAVRNHLLRGVQDDRRSPSFPSGFPSPQAAVAATERRFAHASYYAVVAELEGRIVGSVFLDERSAIASVASITVDPAAQNRMIGRASWRQFSSALPIAGVL